MIADCDHACLAGGGAAGRSLRARRRSCARSARRACRRCSARTYRARRAPFACRTEKGERVADQRCCDSGAETAVLDDRSRGVARIIERQEGHEQRVVAQLPGRARVIPRAAGAEIVSWAVPVLRLHPKAPGIRTRPEPRFIIHQLHMAVDQFNDPLPLPQARLAARSACP